MAFTAGQILTASALNTATRKRIGRARRITNSTSSTSTTALSVLRLDDIPIKALKNYEIKWACHVSFATPGDIGVVQLHYTTDGSTPTSSSSVLPGSNSENHTQTSSQYDGLTMVTDYTPAADQTLSLLMTYRHLSGTGAMVLQGNGVQYLTAIYVDDMGDDPGDTGVDL